MASKPQKNGFRGPSPDVGRATQFKPGVSGNPGGRSKHLLVRTFEQLRPAIRRGVKDRLERIPPPERAERLRRALERI